MPYTAVGKCVYKKNEDGKRGEKVGCTKGAIKDYLAALYASEKNEAVKAAKEIKEALQDDVDPTTAALDIDDQLGTFFIVQKPQKDSTLESIVSEGDLFTAANMFKRGLDFDNVFGLYKTSEKAQKVAENPHHFDREEADAILRCTKNRNGETTPMYKLWFDYKSQQYLEEADSHLHRYLA